MTSNCRTDACRLFIDLQPGEGPPAAGDCLVTIGKRGPGSVYQIIGVKLARKLRPDGRLRCRVTCLRAPDMLPKVQITPAGHAVLPGETVWWMRWYPRKNKTVGATRRRPRCVCLLAGLILFKMG